MAEYVRRKRPPASHPYWARLHDRAHPPRVAVPIGLPAVVGLGLGLVGGLRPEFTSAEAGSSAATVATGTTAVLFVVVVAVLRFDASRQTTPRERWVGAVLSGLAVSVGLYLLIFVATFLVLAWYAAGSGRGPWLGMLIGSSLGTAPAAVLTVAARRRWWRRQRRWPGWERMRGGRRLFVRTVSPVPVPASANRVTAGGRPDPIPATRLTQRWPDNPSS